MSISNLVTRKTAMSVLKVRKHSPTLLFGSGVIFGVATVVTACRSTLKLEEILSEAEKDKADAARLFAEHKVGARVDYPESHYVRDTRHILIRTSGSIVKLYGPSLVLGLASMACLTQSHRILSTRNAGLVAAYASVDKAFDQYRARVVDEYGEDKDRELRFGTESETRTVQTKNGAKTEKVLTAGSSGSMYAKFFDPNNKNWNATPEYNIAFLRLTQNWCNDRLRARGHLFLNEVYEELGIAHTPAGSQVGWLFGRSASGDGYVDFGIWSDRSMLSMYDFMVGREDGIWLDFNVDGVIWDKI